MADLEARFLAYIKQHDLLAPGDGIVLAVSGGVDSVVMAELFRRFSETFSLSLTVAHLNHCLRGKSADRDEDFVHRLAGIWSLPCCIEKRPVGDLARERGLSLEEAGRIVRFEFLEEVRRSLGFHKVALGHQADDQAETVLMHLARGSGLRGMRGMQPQRGNIIHPLLFARKEELLDYAGAEGLDFIEDETNRQDMFLRNRFRHVVIPALREAAGAGVTDRICRSAGHLAEVEELLLEEVQEAEGAVLSRSRNGEVLLDIYHFSAYLKAVKKGILVAVLEKLGPDRGAPGFQTIERLLHLIEQGRSGTCLDLPGAVHVWKSGGSVLFSQSRKRLRSCRVHPGDEVDLPESGLRLRLRLLEREALPPFNAGRDIEYVDFDRLEAPLNLRSVKPGDWFVPLGMNQKKKLHDFFIDEKVPAFQRGRIPLLTAGDEIVAVLGFRIDHRFRITKETRRVMELNIMTE